MFCALYCLCIIMSQYSFFIIYMHYKEHVTYIMYPMYKLYITFLIWHFLLCIYSTFLIWHFLLCIYSTFLIWHFLLCLYSILHAQHSPFFTQKTGYSNEYPGHSPVAMRSLPAPVYGRCGTVQSAPVPLQYRKRQLSLSAT